MTSIPTDLKVADYGHRSWQDAFDASELHGGPSPWGNSRYQTLKVCPYYYWWIHVKRMRPRLYDYSLEVGGLWHEARAFVASTWLDLTDVDHLPAGSELKDVQRECAQAGWNVINRAEKVVPGIAGVVRRLYDTWLPLRGPGAPWDDLPTLYDVECLLQVSEPFPYSTRLDQWHYKPDVGATIKEIKTAGSRTLALIDSYRMDAQFIGHHWLWDQTMRRQYGKLGSYHVDLITTTNDPYCNHETVVIRQDHIRSWLKEMKYLHLLRTQCEMTNTWPQLRTWRCTRGGKPCPLYAHCASGGKYNADWRKKSKKEY